LVNHEGQFDGSGLKIAVVVSRFNGYVTERLLSGAADGLIRNGSPKTTSTCSGVPVPLKYLPSPGRLLI